MKSEELRLDAGEMKIHTYGSLYSINHAFQEIAEHLQRLEDRRMLNPGFAEVWRIVMEESRAGINHAVLGGMMGVEQDDWAYFGKLRITRERVLTGKP
ncbi:MAG TPA: hypothetical protein VNW97_20200 [Candidatus Saccharimonadales bacterium]|jgi:hypothetical protein|nr:hypothetical protein [Candidatus Saccharimonadales bacterium]